MSVSPSWSCTQEDGSVVDSKQGCCAGHDSWNDSVYWRTQSTNDGSSRFALVKRSTQAGRICNEDSTRCGKSVSPHLK
jgi:hypothetical protein